MLAIGILICVVFDLIIKTVVHDLQSMSSPPTFRNGSNVTLASLLPDSLVNSWLDDFPKKAACKVTYSQLLERTDVDPKRKVNSNLFATNTHISSKVAKENFLQSLFRRPFKEVEPDWSVVIGTFEYIGNDNWENYLTQIGIPYLVRLIVSAVSETVRFSKLGLFKDEKKDYKENDKKVFGTELGTTPADFELRIETWFWPFSFESSIRLGEPILVQEIDGSDSLNTYFFAAPHLLILNKKRDPWKASVVLHFHEQGLNTALIERNHMAMAQRFFKRIE